MKKILESFKKILVSFIAGIVVGLVSVYFFQKKDNYTGSEVVVRQISGEKITHDNFNFRGGNITFKTTSLGAGVIETDIPKALIPEAYNWMNRVHTLTFTLGLTNTQTPYYGIMYGYRMGRLTLGGGIDFGSNLFGVKVAVGYCW